MMFESAQLRFTDVCKAYSKKRDRALDGVSFELRQPVAFLVGENGAGKTTAMRLALGAMRPDSGSVAVLGGSAKAALEGGRVGYCPQSFDLPAHLTTREYLMYVSWLK